MPPNEREAEDRMREESSRRRDSAENQKLMRDERRRHDALGVASKILDSRATSVEVVMPIIIGHVLVDAKELSQVSPYETGPIKNALLIRALGGDVEAVQVKQVESRNTKIEGLMADPRLLLALNKYESYDPAVGDQPVELTPDEQVVFAEYNTLMGEVSLIVDSMTNGISGLYDEKDEKQKRINRLAARLDGLKARQGDLNEAEKKDYEKLLRIMFGELKGPEAEKYGRWSNMDPAKLTVEETIMLEDIWGKMVRALDGGEAGELAELEEREVKDLGLSEQKLYDKRRNQLKSAIKDEGERVEFEKMMSKPYYARTEDDNDERDARLELLAEEAGISGAELQVFKRYSDRKEGFGRLLELRKKAAGVELETGERGRFKELHQRAGLLTEAEIGSISTIQNLLVQLRGRVGDIGREIGEKSKKLGRKGEWMDMYKAYCGMVDNINVTALWRMAWHDLGAGAVDSFLQTRWAEYQKTSDLLALMRMGQAGRAMQEAFRAMCIVGLGPAGLGKPVGLGKPGVAGAINIMQGETLTEDVGLSEDKVQKEFIDPIKKYTKEQLEEMEEEKAKSGRERSEVYDLYVDFGVEMARMLFENSFAAGWLGVKRDEKGNIFYKWNGGESSDVNSDAYKYGVAAGAKFGDGSVYADRQNDYIKLSASRHKQMGEFSKGYETGLPAMVPVLPDNLGTPWIKHTDLVEIANGTRTLESVFGDKAESSRWVWAYGIFRGAQVYDTISKFVVGLKGFRGISEEVDFFLKSPSNLGGLHKKIDVVFRDDPDEALRLRFNFALGVLYAVYTDRANPITGGEKKTVVSERAEGVEEGAVGWILKVKKDDIARIFVDRTGFLSSKQWDYLWDKRFKTVYAGYGGKGGVGMLKKGERPKEVYEVTDVSTPDKRRKEIVENV